MLFSETHSDDHCERISGPRHRTIRWCAFGPPPSRFAPRLKHAFRGRSNSFRVAIVGASSLLGKELKQVLEDRNFPSTKSSCWMAASMAGTLTEAAGEPTFIRALDEDSFEGARFAFFAGSAADAEHNWQTRAERSGRHGDRSDRRAGRARAAVPCKAWIPALAPRCRRRPMPRQATARPPAHRLYSSPAAPVIIACTMAAALRRNLAAARFALLLFPPVSERDTPGVEELESQTASLLSFREIAKPVFGAQVAFNLACRATAKAAKPALPTCAARSRAKWRAISPGARPCPQFNWCKRRCFTGMLSPPMRSSRLSSRPEQLSRGIAGLGVKIAAAGRPAPTNVERGRGKRDSSGAHRAGSERRDGVWSGGRG